MESPIISIIIPTYNSGSTLAKAIDSILSQTYQKLEILIMDGLSSDWTISIVEAYANKNSCIKVISEKDSGVYDAMNKGMRIARGEWIYFLGSDDKLYNNSILEEIFDMPEVRDYNVLYGNVKVVGDSPWAKDGDIYDGEFSTSKLLNQNICHQCVFYRNQFVKEVGEYNINYKTCADWDYNLKCWSKTKFFYMPKVVAYFSAGGVSSNYSVDQVFFEDYVKNVVKYFSISLYNPILNNSSFTFYNRINNSVLHHQKRENIFKYYIYRSKHKIKEIVGLIKLLISKSQ